MSLESSDYVNAEYEEDPFEPHERIFSKYSIMLYYSQDAGRNYYIHQDCKYCESCHEKVIQTSFYCWAILLMSFTPSEVFSLLSLVFGPHVLSV